MLRSAASSRATFPQLWTAAGKQLPSMVRSALPEGQLQAAGRQHWRRRAVSPRAFSSPVSLGTSSSVPISSGSPSPALISPRPPSPALVRPEPPSPALISLGTSSSALISPHQPGIPFPGPGQPRSLRRAPPHPVPDAPAGRDALGPAARPPGAPPRPAAPRAAAPPRPAGLRALRLRQPAASPPPCGAVRGVRAAGRVEPCGVAGQGVSRGRRRAEREARAARPSSRLLPSPAAAPRRWRIARRCSRCPPSTRCRRPGAGRPAGPGPRAAAPASGPAHPHRTRTRTSIPIPPQPQLHPHPHPHPHPSAPHPHPSLRPSLPPPRTSTRGPRGPKPPPRPRPAPPAPRGPRRPHPTPPEAAGPTRPRCPPPPGSASLPLSLFVLVPAGTRIPRPGGARRAEPSSARATATQPRPCGLARSLPMGSGWLAGPLGKGRELRIPDPHPAPALAPSLPLPPAAPSR